MTSELGTNRGNACPGDLRIDRARLEQAQLAGRRVTEQVQFLKRAGHEYAVTINDGARSALAAFNRNGRADVTDDFCRVRGVWIGRRR